MTLTDPGVTTMIRLEVEIELGDPLICVRADQAAGVVKRAIERRIAAEFTDHFASVTVDATLLQHTLVDLRR